MQKILIISYAFPPVNLPSAQRPYYFAKYLGRSNFMVTVLTAKNPDSVYGRNKAVKDINNVLVLRTFNFNISWFRTLKNSTIQSTIGGRGIFRIQLKKKIVAFVTAAIFPDKGMLWFPSAIINGIRVLIKNKKMSMFSTSPLFSNHIVALILKKLFNVVWVADIRDFHYTSHLDRKSKGIRKYLHRVIENKIICNADNVVFISNTMLKLYARSYSDHQNKFVCIPNGLDLELYLNQKDMSNLNEKINIVYAGSFYDGERSPFPLLNALEKMLQLNLLKKDEFVIDIYGLIDSKIINKINQLSVCDCIKIKGVMPREEIFKKFKNADILWLIVGDLPHHSAGIPLKLFEYLIFKKFIWAFLPENSEVELLLKELECGEIFTSTNENNTILKILKFIELLRKDRGASPESIPLNKLEKYSRLHQAKQLLALVGEV